MLIPAPEEEKRVAMDANGVVHKAIEKGVPLFNGGDPGACADVYQAAAEKLIGAARDSISDFARWDLQQTVGAATESASDRATELRRQNGIVSVAGALAAHLGAHGVAKHTAQVGCCASHGAQPMMAAATTGGHETGGWMVSRGICGDIRKGCVAVCARPAPAASCQVE